MKYDNGCYPPKSPLSKGDFQHKASKKYANNLETLFYLIVFVAIFLDFI